MVGGEDIRMKRSHKTMIVVMVFIILSVFMNGCRDTYSFSLETLEDDLIKIELVEFGKIDGVEIPRIEQQRMGKESHEIYDVIRTLDEDENELFIKELAAVEFSSIFCEPKSFSEEGVILIYTNKKIYVCSCTLYIEYDDGTHEGFDCPWSPEFDTLMEKYLDN